LTTPQQPKVLLAKEHEKGGTRRGKPWKVAAKLGSKPPHPFATLSFLDLPVIPELRLTDMGLVDVAAFKLIG